MFYNDFSFEMVDHQVLKLWKISKALKKMSLSTTYPFSVIELGCVLKKFSLAIF